VPDVLTLRSGSREQLVVQVNDASGRPIGGAPIEFRSESPRLLGVNETGVVTSLGPVGSGRVRVASGAVAANVSATIVPSSPFRIEKLSGDLQRSRVNSPLPEPLSVRITDANGNPVPDTRLVVEPSQGEVAPAEVISRADGVVEVRWTLGPKAGGQTLRVVVADTERDVSTSFLASSDSGPTAALSKLGEEPLNLVAGRAIEPLRAAVTDEFGNPKPDVEVVWRVLEGGGAVSPAVSTTDSGGIAASTWTTGTRTGINRLEARAEGLRRKKLEFSVETVSGLPARLVAIAGEEQSALAGQPVPLAPALRILDSNGNPVPAVLARFRISEGDGSIANPAAMSDDDGVVRAEGWKLGSQSPCVLDASVEGIEEPLRFRARIEPGD